MIVQADARRIPLADNSVHMCVTSPPYWGLRDYGVSDQLGLEPTPDEYVANMVQVFREVWRVMRDDGTLWLNVGDSYAANRGSGSSSVGKKQSTNIGSLLGRLEVPTGLKEKDLCMIPARLALALQADGWWIRSEITWCKRAPMPESVTDRPTSATEKIYLLTKAARYYYDAEAVKEHRRERDYPGAPSNGGTNLGGSEGGRNLRNFWLLSPEPYPQAHFATFPTEIPRRAILAGSKAGAIVLDPFCGSGTTGQVARQLGRRFVGLDLSRAYLRDLALPRAEGKTSQKAIAELPLFAGVTP